jgi:sRNA-binding protein
MNKKWSPGKVKQTEKWLREKWPALFAPGPDLKPLSTGIYKEILAYRSENKELSGRVLREALKRHTTSFGYLYGMMKNTHRVNLDGEAVEPIKAEHREWASKTLRLLQKIGKKTRKPSGNRFGPKKPGSKRVQALPRKSSTGRSRSAPLIKYKPTRRRVMINPPQGEVAIGGG